MVPAKVFGQADKFVENVHPPGKEDAAKADRQVIGDPPSGAAFKHQHQPQQHKQRGATFADDVQPLPFVKGLGRAERQVQQHADIGGQNQQPEFPAMVLKDVEPSHDGSTQT